MKILIVEDEAISARYTQFTMEKLGYEVCSLAANESEAIDICQREHPHIALMDINLSGQNAGIQLAKDLFNSYQVTSIFISGYPQSDFGSDLNGPFCKGYLQKPYLVPILKATLESAAIERREQ